MELICENVYVLRHPLKVMGCQLGRVATVIRLSTGRTLIHSTASFSEAETESIRGIGQPGWLLEATNFHDTTALEGRAAFPEIPYLVPEGFPGASSLKSTAIEEGSAALDGEIEILKIRGIPKLNEYAVFHAPSRTLILADLLFNLPDSVGGWTKWIMRSAARIKQFPGQSAYFRHFIEDEPAYRESVRKLADLDFDRIIFGHGEPAVDGSRTQFETALKDALRD